MNGFNQRQLGFTFHIASIFGKRYSAESLKWGRRETKFPILQISDAVTTAITTEKMVNTLESMANQKPKFIAVCRSVEVLSVAFIFIS
jgi:predicted MPP superfamily phosphohydrolase